MGDANTSSYEVFHSKVNDSVPGRHGSIFNPRPDTVFRHLRSDRGGVGATPPLAFPNEAS